MTQSKNVPLPAPSFFPMLLVVCLCNSSGTWFVLCVRVWSYLVGSVHSDISPMAGGDWRRLETWWYGTERPLVHSPSIHPYRHHGERLKASMTTAFQETMLVLTVGYLHTYPIRCLSTKWPGQSRSKWPTRTRTGTHTEDTPPFSTQVHTKVTEGTLLPSPPTLYNNYYTTTETKRWIIQTQDSLVWNVLSWSKPRHWIGTFDWLLVFAYAFVLSSSSFSMLGVVPPLPPLLSTGLRCSGVVRHTCTHPHGVLVRRTSFLVVVGGSYFMICSFSVLIFWGLVALSTPTIFVRLLARLFVSFQTLVNGSSVFWFNASHESSFVFQLPAPHRLTREHGEAQRKMKDSSLESDKKTFLKAQIPKMESQIKDLKSAISELLEEQELDPRGEYFLMAQKLIK